MKIRKIFYVIMGIIWTTIGAVGVFLPIVPTTPFLILASFCFAKGSDRFDRWLKSTKLYKNYAEDFVKDRSMTMKRKLKILLMADFMIAFPFVILNNLYIRFGLLVLVSIKYYYFIFVIKTKESDHKDVDVL